MPAPADITFSVSVVASANAALLAAIDASTSAATITLRSDADVALAVYTLTKPAGTVHGTSGVLTLTPVVDQVNAAATGVATWAEIADGNGVAVVSMPCIEGTATISGRCVLNSVTLVSGTPVTLMSVTFG